MRYRLVILSCAAVTAAATAPSMLTAEAQDHGQMGQTWPVIEPDLLSVIKARLDHAQATGKLDANYRDGQLPALRDEDFADILDENDTGCPGLGHTAQERSSPSPESSTTRNS